MAVVTIEIDIDVNGKVSVTPNPATAADDDTVKWHINSNAKGGGSIDVKLPHGANSPFGNSDDDAVAGVEKPKKCNNIEPSTDPIHWPTGVDTYSYNVNFTNSPVQTLQGTIIRSGSHLDVMRLLGGSKLPIAQTNEQCCCCECMLKMFEIVVAALKQPAKLIRAELFTLTGDADNKDHDTGIFVSVKTSDGTMQLASISNADSSGKDMTEYNDDSYHIVPLVVEASGATRAQCSRFKVRVSIKTNGNDTWAIDLARVTLYFNDGTNLVADKADFQLVNDAASVDFSAP